VAFSAAAEWLGQVAAGAPAAAVAAGVDGGGNRPGEKRKNAEHFEEEGGGPCRRFGWWVVGGRPFVERARKSEGERVRRISDSNRDCGF
jgi:hypothetical protein